MPCFTALFKLCEVLHTVLFRKAECFRGIDKPEFSGSQSFTAIDANLESVLESASFVAGVLNGVAP